MRYEGSPTGKTGLRILRIRSAKMRFICWTSRRTVCQRAVRLSLRSLSASRRDSTGASLLFLHILPFYCRCARQKYTILTRGRLVSGHGSSLTMSVRIMSFLSRGAKILRSDLKHIHAKIFGQEQCARRFKYMLFLKDRHTKYRSLLRQLNQEKAHK